jgi:hypothetical protein
VQYIGGEIVSKGLVMIKMFNFSFLGLLLSIVGCVGSNINGDRSKIDSIHNKIDQNSMLTTEEKNYAKRYFDIMIVQAGYIEKLCADKVRMGEKGPYSRQIQPHDIYQKWLIGPGPYSLQEIAYLDNVDKMVSMWEDYQREFRNIDMINLSENTKSLLVELHKRVGDGPINYRVEVRRIMGVSQEPEQLCDRFFVLTGHDDLTDKELLVLWGLR